MKHGEAVSSCKEAFSLQRIVCWSESMLNIAKVKQKYPRRKHGVSKGLELHLPATIKTTIKIFKEKPCIHRVKDPHLNQTETLFARPEN